jgi:hypothetical protein
MSMFPQNCFPLLKLIVNLSICIRFLAASLHAITIVTKYPFYLRLLLTRENTLLFTQSKH